MAGMRTILVLLVGLTLQAPAPTPQQLREQLERIQQELQQVVEQLPKASPITSAADLQTALDAGGTIDLPVSSYAGQFVIAKSGTRLLGNGATLTGSSGAALTIRPGVDDVLVDHLTLTSSTSNAVLQCGDNVATTQGTAALVPLRIVLRNLTIPTHRGKRGIEFNCSGTIEHAQIADVWSSAGVDSQAVWVANTCGPVTVTGGSFVAGSENIMIGGDTLKVTDCPEGVAADLVFDGLTLLKPDAWRTDTDNQNEKNLFEAKAGKRITLRNATLSGSWGPKQDGSAIVVTPKNGQFIEQVLIDTVTVDRAAGGLQLLGKDYNSVTPKATSGVTVRNSRFTLSKAYGGRGILAISTGGMLDSLWENNVVTFDGNAILICDTPAGQPMGPFVMRGSLSTTGPYGVMANGVNYGGPTPPDYAGRECRTTFEGDTFADAPSRFKTNYPANTYVTRAELDLQVRSRGIR